MTWTLRLVLAVLGVIAIAAIAWRLTMHPTPAVTRRQPALPPDHATTISAPASPVRPRNADELGAERERLDRTVWAKEVAAQEYEETFVALWDAMRQRLDDQHLLLAAFPFDDLALKPFAEPVAHRWSIGVANMDGDTYHLDQTAWRALVMGLAGRGYVLEHCEWHHAAFDLDPDGSARSKMSMKLYLTNRDAHQRLVVSGILGIAWADGLDERGHHRVHAIDATALTLTERTGDDAFVDAWVKTPADIGGDADSTVDPVLVYDLDRDGAPDIVLPSLNRVLYDRSRPGSIAFDAEPLCAHPVSSNSNQPGPYITAGVIADFSGDGVPDLMVAGEGLLPTLYVADADGRFTAPGTVVAQLPVELMQRPECMTAGDVDGDGAVDVWIGQYRRPYENGNLPSPYYDADDGWPSYLLLNNRDGTFRDATDSAGLSAKRARRNFSASLVDLDEDGRLDLVTINDFSGIDIFHNLGGGRFEDATAAMVDQRSTFGMSHALADFDGDGRIDLFAAGMGSTTARRLEYMKLGRDEFPEHQHFRMKMGYGNRLFLGQADHRLQQASFNDQVARTGWSWGCSAIDVGNDGDLDLYIANGFMSRSTAKDYCTRFWTQDIYANTPKAGDPVLDAFFRQQSSMLEGMSWNPFEHKALLMNEGGKAFRDVAYPMNVGYEWDGRQVVGADFDGDGREDLLVIEAHMGDRPYANLNPVLHIFRNALPENGHWLAIRLQDEPGCSPMGARIVVDAGGRKRPAVIVSGDSYRCQHPLAKHFGLGSVDRVDAVEVRWADGRIARVEHPAIDQVLLVRPPAK